MEMRSGALRQVGQEAIESGAGTGLGARVGERAAVLLTGLLLVLCFPPFALVVPPFVALVPFLLFVAELPTGAVARWRALRSGFGVGVVYFGLLLHWILFALWSRTALAVPAFALTVGVLACFIAAVGATLPFLTERTGVGLALGAALLWTAAEWLQAQLGDLSFPWLGLGSSLAAFPRLAGAADLVGARGLTFWLVLVNGLVAQGMLALRRGRRTGRAALVLLIVLAGPIAYGLWKAERLELVPVGRVAVVQPNIPQDLKARRAEAIDSTRTAVRNLMATLPPGSVDLVVWPEVTFPTALEHPMERHLVESTAALSAATGAPILAGGFGTRGAGEGAGFTNAAFVVGADGLTGERYDKRRLVPFIERVPFVPEALARRAGERGRRLVGLIAGEEEPLLGGEGARYGVLICFESTFAEEARRYRRAGADFLVNMTNDAWFGGEGRLGRTGALWQHPAHATMRAIELRVGVVRAANTGFSMVIDPLGRSHERTALFTPDLRVATVFTTPETTLYAHLGDWLASSAAFASLLLLLMGRVDRPGRTG